MPLDILGKLGTVFMYKDFYPERSDGDDYDGNHERCFKPWRYYCDQIRLKSLHGCTTNNFEPMFDLRLAL